MTHDEATPPPALEPGQRAYEAARQSGCTVLLLEKAWDDMTPHQRAEAFMIWGPVEHELRPLTPPAPPTTTFTSNLCPRCLAVDDDPAPCTGCMFLCQSCYPAPDAVEKGACPVCGCEEVDHRDLWTCRCPAPAPGLKAVDPGQPYYAATPPALEARVDQELRLQNDREWKAKVDHQKARADAAEACLWSIAHDQTNRQGLKKRAARFLAGRTPRVIAILAHKLKETETERDSLKAALHRISLGSQNSGTTKEDLGREARKAVGEQ